MCIWIQLPDSLYSQHVCVHHSELVIGKNNDQIIIELYYLVSDI